jgi:protein SCO1/2
MESTSERIGSQADQLLLYCYHYDPAKGNYGFVAMRAVRIGGAVTLMALVGFVFVSLRSDSAKGLRRDKSDAAKKVSSGQARSID